MHAILWFSDHNTQLSTTAPSLDEIGFGRTQP
jgi:hypothetical protein